MSGRILVWSSPLDREKGDHSDSKKSHQSDSNRRPMLYESIALPTELRWRVRFSPHFLHLLRVWSTLCTTNRTTKTPERLQEWPLRRNPKSRTSHRRSFPKLRTPQSVGARRSLKRWTASAREMTPERRCGSISKSKRNFKRELTLENTVQPA